MPRPLNLVDVIQGLNNDTSQALAPTADTVSSELLSQVATAAETIVPSDVATMTVASPSTWDSGVWGQGVWL